MNNYVKAGIVAAVVSTIVIGLIIFVVLFNQDLAKKELNNWKFVPAGAQYKLPYGEYPRKIYIDKRFSEQWKGEILRAIFKLEEELKTRTGVGKWLEFSGYYDGENHPTGLNEFPIVSGSNFEKTDSLAKKHCAKYMRNMDDLINNNALGYLEYGKNKKRIVICDGKVDAIWTMLKDKGANKIKVIGKHVIVMHELGHTIWGGNHIQSLNGLMNDTPVLPVPSSLEIEILKKHIVPLRVPYNPHP